MLKYTLIVLLSFELFFEVSTVGVTPGHFCYDNPECGPSSWEGMCQTGKSQSPIDVNIPKDAKFKLTQFTMNALYLSDKKMRILSTNNGHTAQFPLTTKRTSDLKICGGDLKACYRFAQIHFHWDQNDFNGSEHTLGRRRYPLEMHLVHYKENYMNLKAALDSKEPDAIAVMGILFEIGNDDNVGLDQIVKALKNIQTDSKGKFYVVNLSPPLALSSLYPPRKDFARYLGSLTTPNCEEVVIWTVFLSPVCISKSQMQQFRKVKNTEGHNVFNFRPVQEQNGRPVTFYRSGDFTEAA